MKILFIGGTGIISAEAAKLAAASGAELTLLNRRGEYPEGLHGVEVIQADMSTDAAEKLRGREYDVVANFIVFTPEQAERDISLFSGRTGQYIFISSASAYQKPGGVITESTPLHNPFWEYSRNKAACEDLLFNAHRQDNFPVTVVRPSHTYDKTYIPLAVHGEKGSWQVVKRIMDGKPVIVHGDGTSLWTLTHSRDFAKGFCGLLGNPHALGETFHITSDEVLTWDQVLRCVGACVGREPILRHIASDFLAAADPRLTGTLLGDKAHSLVFDNSKIKRLVPGFTATTRFDEGVCEAVRYHLDNPYLQTPDPAFDEWTDRMIEAVDRAFLRQVFP